MEKIVLIFQFFSLFMSSKLKFLISSALIAQMGAVGGGGAVPAGEVDKQTTGEHDVLFNLSFSFDFFRVSNELNGIFLIFLTRFR